MRRSRLGLKLPERHCTHKVWTKACLQAESYAVQLHAKSMKKWTLNVSTLYTNYKGGKQQSRWSQLSFSMKNILARLGNLWEWGRKKEKNRGNWLWLKAIEGGTSNARCEENNPKRQIVQLDFATGRVPTWARHLVWSDLKLSFAGYVPYILHDTCWDQVPWCHSNTVSDIQIIGD